jgi:hypothetical protein
MNTINPSAASQGGTVQSSGAQSAESDRVAAATLLRLIWGMHVSPRSMRRLSWASPTCSPRALRA